MVQIWINPSCSKCAVALDTLEEAGVTAQQRRYLDEAPTADELRDVLRRLGREPWEITRLSEPAAVELDMASWPREPDRWIAALVEHPVLIQRPILILDDGTAVVGRTEQDLRTALTTQLSLVERQKSPGKRRDPLEKAQNS